MAGRPIFVEIVIAADLDRLWRLTQDTAQHPRWDLRFSSITPIADLDAGGYRFEYALRLGRLHTIRGTGTSLGERHGRGGSATSALRFTTRDRLSPLGDGRGYWRYSPVAGGVRFTTGYDYEPGWGPVLDRLVRPIVGWMTAWSFDRLRLWAETGVEPERWPLRSVLWFWRPDRPRASRCARRAPNRRVMGEAPDALATLEAP